MAVATQTASQRGYYRESLMGRASFDPKEFGVDLDRTEMVDRCCEEFNAKYRGMLTIDEVLLHPRVAMRFCDDIREKNGWFDVPDDIILRSILNRRKNPSA